MKPPCAWLLLGITLLLAACAHGKPGSRPAPTVNLTPSPVPSPLSELPRGGRNIFPRFRVVAFYGSATTPDMGVLGAGTPDQAAQRLQSQAQAYATLGRPVLPALELIVTMAIGSPGAGGNYNIALSADTVRKYLAAARRIKALLVLDIQPGRAAFLPLVKRYEKFLSEPDVGLALDPEWKMDSAQVPGKVFGHTDAMTINAVSAYLADLTGHHNLPQKLLVVHEFTADMIPDRKKVLSRRGLALTFHVDGFGGRPYKLHQYRFLSGSTANAYHGIKLFFRQDVDMLNAREAVALKPSPDLITYQ
jgi:hypothetical protein